MKQIKSIFLGGGSQTLILILELKKVFGYNFLWKFLRYVFTAFTPPELGMLAYSDLKSKDTTAYKMKYSIKDFFSKCDEIRRKLRIWLHLQKKFLMENFIFCAVYQVRIIWHCFYSFYFFSSKSLLSCLYMVTILYIHAKFLNINLEYSKSLTENILKVKDFG